MIQLNRVVLGLLMLAACQPGERRDVLLSDLLANPSNYAGQTLCTAGTAVTGFEASALALGTVQSGGATYLTEPAIWLENVEWQRVNNCTSLDAPPVEFCQVRVCGRFETGGGFGHGGGYEYQLGGN